MLFTWQTSSGQLGTFSPSCHSRGSATISQRGFPHVAQATVSIRGFPRVLFTGLLRPRRCRRTMAASHRPPTSVEILSLLSMQTAAETGQERGLRRKLGAVRCLISRLIANSFDPPGYGSARWTRGRQRAAEGSLRGGLLGSLHFPLTGREQVGRGGRIGTPLLSSELRRHIGRSAIVRRRNAPRADSNAELLRSNASKNSRNCDTFPPHCGTFPPQCFV